MSGPIRILELRSVAGTGGGPEKTILLGAARTDRNRFAVTVTYVRDVRDRVFGIDVAARRLGIDYVEVQERHSFDWRVVSALRRIIHERRIEIVHAHDYKTDLLALLLARTDGIIPLATAHGWTGNSWRERCVYYPADKRLLRAFPRVLAVAGTVRTDLEQAGVQEDRIVTLLNGIDHLAFRRDPAREPAAHGERGVPREAFVIGAVGRLERQKRFDILIEACARVAKRHPHVRVLIAGDGSLRASLEAQAAASFAPGVCRLLGHCSDIAMFHHGLDLFVQSSDYEGSPNCVLEAMAFETPIVATTAGGTAEIIRDGVDGLLVRTGDPASLARAIEDAIADKDACVARAGTARRRVETELSFAARQQALEEVYQELMRNHRRRDERGVRVRWA